MRREIALVITLLLVGVPGRSFSQTPPVTPSKSSFVKVNDQVVTQVFTDEKGNTVTAQVFTIAQINQISKNIDAKYGADKAMVAQALAALGRK